MDPVVDNFSELFVESPNSQAVNIIYRVFGDVVSLARGDALSGSETWLNTLVELFNTAGMLGMVVVLLYTVLTTVFDTAKDGTLFGNQADARYTVMRVLGGAISFVPVQTGFSIAQLILIWLAIQGSALGDTAWRLVSERELQGSSFIGPPRFERTEGDNPDVAVRIEFGRAFDTLVNGVLCQQALNTIARNMDGSAGTPGGLSPVVMRSPAGATEQATTRRQATPAGDLTLTKTEFSHYIRFEDTTASYSGSTQLCGGVGRYAIYEVSEGYLDANRDFFAILKRNAQRQDMRLYADIMSGANGLASDAIAVANEIWTNNLTDAQIREMSLSAVDRARNRYVTGTSDIQESVYTPAQLDTFMESVRQKINLDGWVSAATWQRALSLAAVEQRAARSDFEINTVKESNTDTFLDPGGGIRDWNGSGWFSRTPTSPIVADQLASLRSAQTRWGTIAPALVSQTRGASPLAPTALSVDGGEELRGALGKFYGYVTNAFAVRESEDAYNDPMIDVQEFGRGMMQAGAAITAAGAASKLSTKRVPVIGEALAAILLPVGYGFLAIGFAAAALIPMIPVVYFFAAAMSWLIMLIEGMFALPLAILSLFAPSRDGTLIGSWNRILLSIFGIFLRPLFTVAGLFFGMVIIAVGLDLSNTLFQGMISIVSATASFWNIITMFGIVFVSILVTFYTVMLGASMITEIGDSAMALFGIGISHAASRMNVGDKMSRSMGEAAMPTRVAIPRPNLVAHRAAGEKVGSFGITSDLGEMRRLGNRAVKMLPGPKRP